MDLVTPYILTFIWFIVLVCHHYDVEYNVDRDKEAIGKDERMFYGIVLYTAIKTVLAIVPVELENPDNFYYIGQIIAVVIGVVAYFSIESNGEYVFSLCKVGRYEFCRTWTYIAKLFVLGVLLNLSILSVWEVTLTIMKIFRL